MSLKSINILSAVLCEEVRQEVGGRAIIIGAMAHGPELSDGEDTRIKRLAVYTEIEMPENRIRLKLRLASKNQVDPVLQADVNTDEMYDDLPSSESWARNPIAVLIFGRENFMLRGSGDYHLQYAVDDEDWVDCRKFYFPKADPKEE